MINNIHKSFRINYIHFSINRPRNLQFYSQTSAKMPLVVPGITSNNASSKTDDWLNKLAGKKLGDTSDATVRSGYLLYFEMVTDNLHRPLRSPSYQRRQESFSQDRWSPRTSRQIGMFCDHSTVNETGRLINQRLNVHLAEDGTVSHVDHQ